MKLLKNIKQWSCAFMAAMFLMTSCDFLDVVPPEQAELPDATKTVESTLGFLYSCYAGVRNPMPYTDIEASADEYALPPLWMHTSHKAAYDLNTPQSSLDHRWGRFYRFIGQTLLFLKELDKTNVVTDEKRKEWIAEANFLLAYYHFEILRFYGPCPITDTYIPENTPTSEYNGRSHYDYVTEWIVNKLDEAIENGLPQKRSDVSEWGRATTVIAKALKAKVLLYAASPLWNGKFPYPNWENKVETPGYGKELVSKTYKKEKWVRAEKACKEALQSALDNGYELFQNEEKYKEHNISLPYIPGVNINQSEGEKFAKKVLLMRYVIQMRPYEGNREMIWGLNSDDSNTTCSMPTRVLKHNNGTWFNGWSGISPYLYTIEHFYTKNGKLPEKDPLFRPKADWLKSAGIQGREDIININLDREPRYYAWIAFNGGDFSSAICEGKPLKLEMRDGEKQGYNPNNFNRDHCVTGFLTQKYIQPNLNRSRNNSWNYEAKPKPLIRMAELYLNLAECQDILGDKNGAIQNLNVIRKRAGIPELQESDITAEMTLTDWVRNERFIELWGEGHRFFDIRRWVEGPKYLGAGKREGLNAEEKINPTFEEYNRRIKVPQPYKWSPRMYIAPIFYNESYKNPQMVQAPGY
ncbi:RagB/SusD family nutrient uptake outer membrane protein [Bacteroides pyogenes]|uniref:RagB/SusD family nutrient uptake outer membrane protein n=1 Tax=Bacteroides pyogenes TaxID=310300 RepID=UPI0011E40475|nr:RagB/SusD family nutrient uptake outer membrane protein [Bacteroides pyogenes]TYK39960.1 RagB/SusD family nutrient uptake outer membrane protein [Bacteroides pyogenes]